MTTVLLILIAVLLFCLIIFVHEFGHFITAKSFGVRVNEFSLGMGPKIFGFTKGDTTYSLRLLPIGGYCAMEGEDEESADARAFCNKKVWKRMIIVVAGAVINILLGIVLCFTQVVQEDVFLSTTLSGVGDAVSVEEVLKMQRAQEESGKVLMVMRNNRYVNTSRYMKKYIADGKAGELYTGRCGWIRRRGIPGKGGWFTTKAQSGGGPLIDLGVHMIDLAIWLMGNPRPVAVTGCTYMKFADNDGDSNHARTVDTNELTYDVEDLATGFIKFDNGASLQIEFSWASNIAREKRFIELRGTKSGFTWENGELEIYGEENGVPADIIPKFDKIYGGHGDNLAHFYDVIANGTEADFVPQQGVDMIKILTAIYESAETGKEIQL